MLKSYAELGHVYRCDPCVEYPGTWIVFGDGNQVGAYDTLEDAVKCGNGVLAWDNPPDKVSICWQASNGDPRIAYGWFTSFYRAYEL